MWSKKAGSYTLISKCPFNDAAYIQDTIILNDLKVLTGKTRANSSPTSPSLAFPTASWGYNPTWDLYFPRQVPKQKQSPSHVTRQEVGLHWLKANTFRLCFTLSEEGIPEGERVFQRPAVAVQACAATWRRARNQAKQNWQATLAFGSLAYLCWKWYSLQKNKCTCAHTQLLNKNLAFLHRGQGKGSN